MAKTTVEIVLQDDVEHVGRCGDVVRVKPGYARNYLLPRGLAAMATRGSVAQIAHHKAIALKRASKLMAEAQARAGQLTEVSVEIPAQAGEGGKLFGSVGARDIAAALEAAGHSVDRKKIKLSEPLKALGEHEVSIKLGHEITATVKVNVVRAE